jgi:hypothetical protein
MIMELHELIEPSEFIQGKFFHSYEIYVYF